MVQPAPVTRESTTSTEPVFTFPGDTVRLRVETDVELPARVTVSFRANTFVRRHEGASDRAELPAGGVRGPALEWSEELECRRVGTGARHAHRFEVPWVVAVRGGAPRRAFEVSYHVEDAGKRFEVAAERELIVRTIKLTRKPTLLRIMLHEFARLQPTGEVHFDPSVPEQFIDALTPQQRKLLYTAGTEARPRLVTFVTFTPRIGPAPPSFGGGSRRKRHPMAADGCRHRDPFVEFSGGKRVPIDINDTKKVPSEAEAKRMTALRRRADIMWSNASFTVFRCAGPTRDVTLVCHTEHFLMNAYNTRQVFLQGNAGKPSGEWLSPANPAPPRFSIVCTLPGFGDPTTASGNFHDAMWHQVLKGDGADLMPGNFMHSMINTNGCWMLFRNFNYPEKYRQRLSTEGIMSLRWPREWDGRGTVTPYVTQLRELGYDEAVAIDIDRGTLTSSRVKWAVFDRNFAAVWFAHDVLGIRYWGGSDFVNDYRTHGLGSDAQVKQFPVEADFGGWVKQYDPYDPGALRRYAPRALGLPPLEGGVEREPEDGDLQEVRRRPGERGPDPTWVRQVRSGYLDRDGGEVLFDGASLGPGTKVVHVDNSHPTSFIRPAQPDKDQGERDPRDSPAAVDARTLNAMWVKNAFGDQVATGFGSPWCDLYFYLEPGAVVPNVDDKGALVPHPEDQA